VASADRAREIVELRTRRHSFAAIGERFGIAPSRVHSIYTKALADIPAAAVDEHRKELNLLADVAIARLVELAEDENTSPRTATEAWSAVHRWVERVCKLNGLDVVETAVITSREVYSASPELLARLALARRALGGEALVVEEAPSPQLEELLTMARRRSENQHRELRGEPPLRDDEQPPERKHVSW
jgi:hypothetical protein